MPSQMIDRQPAKQGETKMSQTKKVTECPGAGQPPRKISTLGGVTTARCPECDKVIILADDVLPDHDGEYCSGSYGPWVDGSTRQTINGLFAECPRCGDHPKINDGGTDWVLRLHKTSKKGAKR